MRVRTIRPGRKVQWIEAALLDADEREMARATVLRLRSRDVDTSGSVVHRRRAPPPPPDGGNPPSVFVGARRRRLLVARTTCASCAATGPKPGPGHRVVPAAVPGRCGRRSVAVLTGGGVGRLRERRRQPAALHARERDQRRRHDRAAPAPDRRVGLPRVGVVGEPARRRSRGDAPARRARSDRPRGADAACWSRSANAADPAFAPKVEGSRELAVGGSTSRRGRGRRRRPCSSNSPLRNTSIAGRPASGGRRSPRLLSTRTAIVRRPAAVSIVTRSDVFHLNADGGSVSDWNVENFCCLPARRCSDCSTRSKTGLDEAVGELGPLDLVLHDLAQRPRP